MNVPRDLIEQNKMITLTVDIMFINGIPFLIMYGQIDTNQDKEKIALNLTKVIQLYAQGGFCIQF